MDDENHTADKTIEDFKFACESCGQSFLADASQIGRKVECPTCKEEIIVPSTGSNFPGSSNAPRSRTAQQGFDTTRERQKDRYHVSISKRLVAVLVVGIIVAILIVAIFPNSKETVAKRSKDGSSEKGQLTSEELFKNGLKFFTGEKFEGEAFLRESVERHDIDKAIDYFLPAAKQGHSQAQYYLAVCYGSQGQMSASVQWLEKSAHQGLSQSEYLLGVGYLNGEGVQKDEKTGLAWIAKSAEHDYADAQWFLGRRYLTQGNGTEDLKSGLELLQRAADQKHARACQDLGECYADGIAVECNPEEATKWFATAALETGHLAPTEQLGKHPLWASNPEEQVETALRYMKGDGLPENLVNAIWLFKKAALKGHAGGQYWMGHCHRFGLGVEKDYEKSLDYYRRSAAQGYAEAEGSLGDHYSIFANKNEIDVVKGIEWYVKAGAKGNAASLSVLMARYKEGNGVPANLKVAYMYAFLCSIVEENEYYSMISDELKKNLSNAERKDAERMALRWKRDKKFRTELTRRSTTKEAEQQPVEIRKKNIAKLKIEPVDDIALEAISVFKTASLTEARECIQILDDGLSKFPDNETLISLRKKIKAVFRSEASLTSAKVALKSARNKLSVEQRNLEVVSIPSKLTGKINQNSLGRVRRQMKEASKKIAAGETKVANLKKALKAQLESVSTDLPEPSKRLLTEFRKKISRRNGL